MPDAHTAAGGEIVSTLRCERQYAPHDFRINKTALKSYIGQLREVGEELGLLEQNVLFGQVLVSDVTRSPSS